MRALTLAEKKIYTKYKDIMKKSQEKINTALQKIPGLMRLILQALLKSQKIRQRNNMPFALITESSINQTKQKLTLC